MSSSRRVFVSSPRRDAEASWLSLSLIFNILLELLATITAWALLAVYLCVFSLQATWMTLRNVASRPRAAGTLVIGSPVGPVLKNGVPLAPQEAIVSPASTAVSYENAYYVKPMDRHDKENSPPVSNLPPKSHASKSSRALHVLSSITHSFSRSSLSLASFKSNRNVSGASAASSVHSTAAPSLLQTAPKHSTSSSSMRLPLIPRFDTAEYTTDGTNDRTNDETTDGFNGSTIDATTDSPTDGLDDEHLTNSRCQTAALDPKLIYTAQPSAYWSGRFVALRDRYHSELLEPATLQCVLEEHARRSQPEPHLQSDIQSVGITTTDLYNKNNKNSARQPQGTPSSSSSFLAPPPRNLTHHHHPFSTRQPGPSSTLGMGIGTGTPSFSRPPLSSGLSRLSLNSTNSTPRPGPGQSQSQAYNPSTAPPRPSLSSSHNHQHHHHQAGNMPPPPPPTLHTTGASSLASAPVLSGLETTTPAARRRELILLTSDDARRARVFAALQSLCATPEARESLRQWQTAYARRTGRECLLPVGGRMVDDKRGRVSMSGWGMGRRSLGRREGSVVSSTGTAVGEKKEGWTSRLRVFSGGRRSQLMAMDGQGRSRQGASVLGGTVVGGGGQRYGREGSVGAASEPAWAMAGTGLPLPTEVGGRGR
ncbi:hypothetical protein GE09DRAFT_1278260 [Coniochaeta sp. 2T2.1]|nr:hypothetical protein GE09DRAFT_1278260 [Coniochaeta sp. 2T2.1]